MIPADRLRHIDGLRAVAALWVVLGHWWTMYYNSLPGPPGWFTGWLNCPHLAVAVFIVLSGYCLMLPIARHGSADFSAVQFYRRRAVRILPPLYATMVCSFALYVFVARQSHQLAPVTPAAVLANVLLLQDWFTQYNFINDVLWSVALEIKIYLLVPLLLWAVARMGWPAAVSVVAVSSYSVGVLVLLSLRPNQVFLACPWYVLLFMLGGFSAACTRQSDGGRARRRDVAVLVLALAGTVTFVSYMSSTLTNWSIMVADGLVGVASAELIFLLACGRLAWARRVLSAPSLVLLGTMSYSLYLVHLPLLRVARIVCNRLAFVPAGSASHLVVTGLIALPLIGSATAVMFYFVERPCMRRRRDNRAATLASDAIVSPAP